METTSSSRLKQQVERLWPRLSFHYGLSFEELAEMPRWLMDIYLQELPRLLAEQQMAALEASAYPNLKKQDQTRISKRLSRMMSGGRVQAPKVDIVGSDPEAPGASNPMAGMFGVTIEDPALEWAPDREVDLA